MSSGAWDLTKQCFQVATGLPGKSATENIPISPEWKNLDSAEKHSPASTPSAPGTPQVNKAKLDKMALAAFKRADSEEIADELLVGFMKRYPPTLWKEKPGSTKMLEQCERAANAWYAAAKAKGMWTDPVKQQFARFTEGLEIKTAK